MSLNISSGKTGVIAGQVYQKLLDMQNSKLTQDCMSLCNNDREAFIRVLKKMAEDGWAKTERLNLVPLDGQGNQIDEDVAKGWLRSQFLPAREDIPTNFKAQLEVCWFKTDWETTESAARPIPTEKHYSAFLAEFQRLYLEEQLNVIEEKRKTESIAGTGLHHGGPDNTGGSSEERSVDFGPDEED